MQNRYLSRKFILSAAGAVLVLINSILEAHGLKAMDQETVMAFVGLLASYVLGESWVDSQRAKGDKS